LNHIGGFIGDVVTGTTVTPTAGNTETQNQQWPFADTLEDVAVTQLVEVMKLQSDYRLGTLHTANLTDPVGYNVGYLTGYGNARKLIKEKNNFLNCSIKDLVIPLSGSILNSSKSARSLNLTRFRSISQCVFFL
jgi:hypothetical protein